MAPQPGTPRLLSLLDVQDFGGETVRVGDLDGDGAPDLLFAQDGRSPSPGAERETHVYFSRAEVWGDSRQEVLYFGCRTAGIWTNTRPLALPTLYSHTLYPGM